MSKAWKAGGTKGILILTAILIVMGFTGCSSSKEAAETQVADGAEEKVISAPNGESPDKGSEKKANADKAGREDRPEREATVEREAAVERESAAESANAVEKEDCLEYWNTEEQRFELEGDMVLYQDGNSRRNILSVNFGAPLAINTELAVILENGDVIMQTVVEEAFQGFVFASSDLIQGESIAVLVNGEPYQSIEISGTITSVEEPIKKTEGRRGPAEKGDRAEGERPGTDRGTTES